MLFRKKPFFFSPSLSCMQNLELQKMKRRLLLLLFFIIDTCRATKEFVKLDFRERIRTVVYIFRNYGKKVAIFRAVFSLFEVESDFFFSFSTLISIVWELHGDCRRLRAFFFIFSLRLFSSRESKRIIFKWRCVCCTPDSFFFSPPMSLSWYALVNVGANCKFNYHESLCLH